MAFWNALRGNGRGDAVTVIRHNRASTSGDDCFDC
jgi:hypothetical protein